ncbi:MAG: 16S rRNA (cytosine(1402)-N(4))-methyltransferase RsmH [Patescibacteria group bacterium]
MRTSGNLIHTPVLLNEVITYLNVKPGGKYIDCTVGAGGHATEILKLGGEILGLDQDPQSVKIARRNLESCPGKYKLVVANFSKISQVAKTEGFENVEGVLMDLGFASFQIDDPTRGLSFSKDGLLDMRLDPNLGVTAADLVNSLPERELERLFREIGEELKAQAIARAIAEQRRIKPFKSTRELAELVERSNSTHWSNRSNLHPATRVFMALRIAVNSELENLKVALPQAFELLKPGGRLAIISFHSGEDRIVKTAFRDWEKTGKARAITKKPLVPSQLEVDTNPRARSAKLRVIEKHDKSTI